MRTRRPQLLTDLGLAFVTILGLTFAAWALDLLVWAVEHVHGGPQ